MKKLLLVSLMTTSLQAGVFGPSRGKINAIKDKAESAQNEIAQLKAALQDKESIYAQELNRAHDQAQNILARIEGLESRETTILDKLDANTELLLAFIKETTQKTEDTSKTLAHAVTILGENTVLFTTLFGQFSQKLNQLTAVVDRLLGAESDIDNTLIQ